MDTSRKRNKHAGVFQLITGVLLAAEFAGFAAWNLLNGQEWIRKPLYIAALAAFAVVYTLVSVLIVGRATKKSNGIAESEEWFDRTMNLDDLVQTQESEIEYEITFLHSDYLIM